MGQKGWLALTTSVLGLAMVSLIALGIASCGQDGDLDVFWDMPPFSFDDQTGQVVTKEDLLGKVAVANFVFTHCTQYCSAVLSPRMQDLQEELQRRGLLGERVVLLSFSVDPERDTPEVLRAYAERFEADPASWHFLTGPPDEMERVVTAGLKLGVQKIEQPFEHSHLDGSVHRHEYDVAHTNRFLLVDRLGGVRAYYDGLERWDAAQVLRDIDRLLG